MIRRVGKRLWRGGDLLPRQAVQQEPCRQRPDLGDRLGDHGDLRVGEGGEVEIVKTDQAVHGEQGSRTIAAAEQADRRLDGVLDCRAGDADERVIEAMPCVSSDLW